MRFLFVRLFIFIFTSLTTIHLFAEAGSRKNVKVGRKAAEPYFQGGPETRSPATDNPFDHVLMLHYGKFTQSSAYNWKDIGKVEDVGQQTYGLTYLFDQWSGIDVNFRIDFNEYDLSGTKASKMSFLPLLTFPKAETRFPLYFGISAGLGIFFQQVPNKSNLAFDYQLIMGARFLDISPGVGFFIEYGMTNHLHLLSEGQLNGSKVTLGPVFNF